MVERSPEDIFHEARTLPPAERAAYLKGACGTDGPVRGKVDALLAADAAAGSFLDEVRHGNLTADVGSPDETCGHEQEGQMVGRYKLLELIGEGGFGSVWMAEQREPVKRRAALKIIKLGMDTKQVIARFEAERQALALMDHPNIARVLDAGSTDTGRPYFVMELVRGVPILDYCDTEKLTTENRLQLFTQVCHAIQHAHQKGIIHRDIKPSNVLVTHHDGLPVVKVIDFGIAKATNTELTTKTLFTLHRQMIGTPVYMSPEQAEMSGLDIDTRSDVYSLGVLLYELLTGTTPFNTHELMNAGLAEMMRIIRETEPDRPSTRLSALGDTATKIAGQRRADPSRLGHLLRGDLDWIVMKCLEKDRTRRYETANALAADLKRYLSDEPVSASPPGNIYRLRKFVRRNRAGVLAAIVVMVGLLAGLSVATVGFLDARRERDRARAAEDKARLLRHLFSGGEVSLAVLPLKSATQDPEQEYFADGVTSSLVADLERISALRVVSDESVRSAVRRAGSEGSLHEIATHLKVDGVVQGWVERRGEQVLLTVNLIHALTNQELWQRDYVDELRRLERMKHAVARDIASELQLELTDKERGLFANARELDPEAQEAYLKGRFLLQKNSLVAAKRALEYFDRAIELEPEFARAHAGRAQAFSDMENQFLAPHDTMPHAKKAALRAIELDESLAEAHTELGRVSLHYDWDWAAAEASFRKSIELNPDYAPGYAHYALYLACMRRPDDAIEYLEKALEVDPFAVFTSGDTFICAAYLAREYDQAIHYARSAIELDSTVWFIYTWLGLALAEKGLLDEALAAAERGEAIAAAALENNPDDPPGPIVYAVLGWIHALRGSEGKSRAALAEMERQAKQRFVCPYEIATVHIALGEVDEAFQKMAEAIETRSACIPALRADPRLDSIRSDERFGDLLHRSGHREASDAR